MQESQNPHEYEIPAFTGMTIQTFYDCIKYAFFKYGVLRNAERLDSSFHAERWNEGITPIKYIR